MTKTATGDIVELELRGRASPAQLEVLKANPAEWRRELLARKRSVEAQMTAHKTRAFELHTRHRLKKITDVDYLNDLQKEKVWKTNATRFIQQVESKLMELSAHEV